MSTEVKQKLIEMVKRDEETRANLIRRGELFDGYHSEMEQVHNQNADLLAEIIQQHGWPTIDLVGEEGSSAAWMIVQHAIAKPDFQKQCLQLLKSEKYKAAVEPKFVAYLEDRILIFEGKPQIYGTQFDWDNEGLLSPNPILDPTNVETRRKSVGLSPLKEVIIEMRKRADEEGNKPPADLAKRTAEFTQWARKAGWRK